MTPKDRFTDETLDFVLFFLVAWLIFASFDWARESCYATPDSVECNVLDLEIEP